VGASYDFCTFRNLNNISGETVLSGKNSHAFLPAVRVADACAAVLCEITLSRKTVAEEVVTGYLKSGADWKTVFRTRKSIAKHLPPGLKEIADLHRSAEEKTVRSLMDLAKAAHEDDEEFRVYVSSGDFALVSNYYGNRG
jgi:hypothetical protein